MSNAKFTNFEDLLNFFSKKKKECPKGVNLKLQKNKYLLLQFTFPDTQKRSTKSCNTDFTEEGIILAVAKSKKVREALDTIPTASEFWAWYDKEILGVNPIKNDLRTYREIFQEIEDEYFNGVHKNTKRKRSREIASDRVSFYNYKGVIFERFPVRESYPNWTEIKEVLYSWTQGTKSFKDAYHVLRDVARRSANHKALLERFDTIDPTQTIFSQKQSCSWDEFYNWYLSCYSEIPQLNEVEADDCEGWLWVAAMCVVYGLRPSEIAAAQNLTKPWNKDGVTIPALTAPDNKDLLLVIGEWTYFGASTKTGERITKPMVTDKSLWVKLGLNKPKLPIYAPLPSSNQTTVSKGFSNAFRERLEQWKCPVTQAYAFRHLSNQLGEKYGIPQEIRARILGHSVAVNDRVYKKRKNLKTEIDLLLNHSRQPLDYESAIVQLKALGIDTEDNSVKLTLRVIYQQQ